jgi:GT2 family glycosyltransferase
MTALRAAVVIACYRHADSLRQCLASLSPERQGDGFETVVVNVCGDPAVAEIVTGFERVTIVNTRERLWPGAARNRGVRSTHGDFLLFLDADCIAEAGWVGSAMAALDAGARLAGGPVLDLLPTHPVAVTDNLLQFAEHGPQRPDGPAVRFPACSLAIRRSDFDALGSFPEALRMGEDTRLCALAFDQWPGALRFVQTMRVRHRGRRSFRALIDHQYWLGFARGVLRTDLTPRQQRLARNALLAPAVVLKRLSYILGRTARWRPAGMGAALMLTPLLTVGLFAFAAGLRRGLRGGPPPPEPW